jgi:hypothetical protein
MRATKISFEASALNYWQKMPKIIENLSVKNSRDLIGCWLGTDSENKVLSKIPVSRSVMRVSMYVFMYVSCTKAYRIRILCN